MPFQNSREDERPFHFLAVFRSGSIRAIVGSALFVVVCLVFLFRYRVSACEGWFVGERYIFLKGR